MQRNSMYNQIKSEEVCELDKAIKATYTEKLYRADTVEQLMADLMK